MKQITQIVHNKVKNPNWSEANQLAVNKRGGGLEPGATENNPASGQGDTSTLGLRVSSSALEDLNSGLLRTNPASSQRGTWTRGLRISSSALEDWTRDYWEKIQLAVRAGLEHGICRMQVQHSNHWAKLPSSFSNLISITDGKSMVRSEKLARYLVQLKL